MKIKSRIKNYEVNIVQELPQLNAFGGQRDTFFVIDKNVFKLYPQLFKDILPEHLYLLEALESNKTIDFALQICDKIVQMNAKKNVRLVSFGGGIVQDITGFVSNIMYRGISWIFVPTTLLSACDSCIGSKTSLNYKSYKNLLGTFYPPDAIIICSKFFNTLSQKDYNSGLGEVVKFNVMSGQSGINDLREDLPFLLSREEKIILKFVEKSLLFKKRYIEQDEFDKGERIYLNFAHTFGHAIEVSSEYQIPHGSAVAIGMLIANRISYNRGMLSNELESSIENLVESILPMSMDINWFDYERIIGAIRKDKKQIADSFSAVLLKEDLNLEIVHNLTRNEIIKAIKYFLCLMNIQVASL